MFAEGVLQPQDLCVIFHFCNRTAAHGEAGKISFSLNNEKVAVFGGNGELPTEMVQKTWMDRVNRRWKERGGGGGGEVRGRGVGVGGEMEKAADAPATVLMKENSLENRGVGVKGVSGLGVKEEDVIFLHLSDIHLDQQYSEVIYIYKTEKTFKNEQISKDAAAKKRPNTSGVGKINNYYEDIYIPPNNNTD